MMHLRATFVGALVLLSVHVSVYGQVETEWAYFESFFATDDQPPLEEALYSANLKLEQAREIMDGGKTANELRNLGLLYLNRVHDYEKAMDFFVHALAIEDSLNLESQRALTFVAISRVFEVVGDYYKSAQFLSHALKLNEADRDINSLATILINLGKVNALMGNLDGALRNYEQVLKYREDIDRKFEAEALSNLAQVFATRGNHSQALDYHKKALRITREVNDRYAEALCLNNIGVHYGMMKNEEKSLANHEVALEIRQALKDQPGMAESYNHIGWWYYRQEDPEKAIASAKLALESGLASQAQEQIFKSYELLSQSYKDLEDYENGLHYKELSLAIHEFMQNEKHERQLLETQNRYVLGKKETEIEKLDALRLEREREIAAQKKFRNILFLLVGLVLVIALLVLYLYLVKRRSNRVLEVAKNEVQKQNVRLQQLNHTKDKFFSIISHDLKGPLNSLTSFSHLLIEHTDSMSKEEIQLLAKDLDKSVKNLYTLLENLLEWSRSQTGNIDFTGEVFDLTELLESNKSLLEAQARYKKISITLNAPSACHVKLHKPSINTVLRNLLSNAIKFTPEGGGIDVSLQTSDKRISVAVSDNGVGMSPEVVAKLFRIDTKHSTKGTANERGTGLGLILCREFIEKNGGVLSVRSEPGKGSVFIFSFPPSSLRAPIEVAEPASF
jgi:signal transduction histidine kinase